MKIAINIHIFLFGVGLFMSCKKQDDWLNVKPNKSDVVPSKVKDFQAFLDYTSIMNINYPNLGLVSSDDYYVPTANFQANKVIPLKNAYLWKKDLYEGKGNDNWTFPYIIINYSNVVLDGLNDLKDKGDIQQFNTAKGSALFFRAYAHYNLNQLFANPYSAAAASTDLAVPLRLNSNVNEKSVREPLEKTYTQIIGDLKTAITLLPIVPAVRTRPCRPAANALLAKVYLTMQKYDSAAKYAALVISEFPPLLNYNTVSTSNATRPLLPTLTAGHPEVIFYAECQFESFFIYPSAIVDSTLYSSYVTNDLRRVIFFRSNPTKGVSFRGYYTGKVAGFSGIASNEIYLIRAEANARLGNVSLAMSDLNSLLRNRWKTLTYTDRTAVSKEDALTQILTERRKELLYNGSLRWEDLRRLNQENAYAITLKRIINNEVYSLPPNDPRYTLPIPDIEIKLSGIAQNER